MKQLNISAKFLTQRDSNNKFINGTVQIFTETAKELIQTCLEKQVTIPTVNCSRDGTKCPTSIAELQIHNGHVPNFEIESDLLKYTNRIITDVSIEATNLGMVLALDDSNPEPKKLLETYSDSEPSTEWGSNDDNCDNCDEVKPLKMFKFLQDKLLCQECGEALTAQGEALAESAIEEQEIKDMEENEETNNDDLPW